MSVKSYQPDMGLEKNTKEINTLHVRESNPGRLRDRQKCYQLHQHEPIIARRRVVIPQKI